MSRLRWTAGEAYRSSPTLPASDGNGMAVGLPKGQPESVGGKDTSWSAGNGNHVGHTTIHKGEARPGARVSNFMDKVGVRKTCVASTVADYQILWSIAMLSSAIAV